MQTSVKVFVLCLILCISLVTALQFGAKFISLDQIISALMSMIDANTTASMTDTIITDIRLPRLIYSVLTGIGLSLVGLLMQTVTRNALADPYVLGVSSGASTGAVFAIIIHKELLIPALCGIFLMENLSVVMQVSYFKYTKRKFGEGRRIFLMAPLHHHFQKKGIPEPKIVTRFWIIGIILAVVTIVTLKIR